MTGALPSLFLTCPPGLEPLLAEEARGAGFAGVEAVAGGVAAAAELPEAMRANLILRGAGRVLLRIAEFRAMHLAQLDKRARKVDWPAVLRGDVPVRVEATTRASRIYHAGAAADRVARAIAEATGAPVTAVGGKVAPRTEGEDAPEGISIRVRIDDDLCTLSLDTSGAPLHRRGHKEAVGKAPMRETLAALLLRACGFDGTEPVIDPMCGSGTFVIEAAEIALGLAPGRSRGFAFERLAGHDPAAWAALKAAVVPRDTPHRFTGSDRDDGAIRMAAANAARAGVSSVTAFHRAAISDLARPEGAPGLVIVNPPYGARIGERKLLFGLYDALGRTLTERFSGWRVGLVTSDTGLARATGLPFLPEAPQIPHGGLRIRLFRTAALP